MSSLVTPLVGVSLCKQYGDMMSFARLGFSGGQYQAKFCLMNSAIISLLGNIYDRLVTASTPVDSDKVSIVVVMIKTVNLSFTVVVQATVKPISNY